MKQDTARISKDLEGCTTNDEVEKHKAEIEKLKGQMEQQVTALKKQILKI